MDNLQEKRRQFKEGNPGFPTPLWKKLLQEGWEAAQASFDYLRDPTEANSSHLGEELADMVFVIMDMASRHKIDLKQEMEKKLAKDNMRFPPGTVMRRGDYRKRKIQLGERRI